METLPVEGCWDTYIDLDRFVRRLAERWSESLSEKKTNVVRAPARMENSLTSYDGSK